MGAGNDYFLAPAGEDWSMMVYVDIADPLPEDEQVDDFVDWEASLLHLLQMDLSTWLGKDLGLQDWDLPTINDARVVAEVSNMVIAIAYTYDGDRLALIVTPKNNWQELICQVDEGLFRFERGWRYSLQEMRRENARLLNMLRAVKTGRLCREMQTLFQRLLLALEDLGWSSRMSFRDSAWTSSAYQPQRTAVPVVLPHSECLAA
ncbi:hypothetical protein HZU77_015615 [Neisseriaceae bacterium TC5R-5]|nr:hypothetical protein [Neisseriaceae bacterium TC5R-5]